MADPVQVPFTSNFAEVYSEDASPTQRKRWNSLIAKFEKTYNRKPDFISRSPGRVNIIGEVRSSTAPPTLPLLTMHK